MDQKLNRFSSSMLVILTLFAASAEPILVKIGYQQGYSSFSLIFFRNIVACIASFFLSKNHTWLEWRLLLKVISLAVLLFIVNGATIFALQFTNVSSVTVIVMTTPIFVALINQWLGRDLLYKYFWIGLGAACIGVCLSVGMIEKLPTFHMIGLLLMALAVTASTTYRVFMESVTKEMPPSRISFYIFFINALLSLACFPFFKNEITLDSLSVATWTGITAVLANIAFLSCIHLIGSTRMSVIDMLQRPLIVISAFFILNETITKIQIVGCLLTFFGAQLARVKRVSLSESSN